jgi:hypothetical protein
VPRGSILTEEHKTGGLVDQFDYLKFTENGEWARLLIVGDYWWEWSHLMRAPVIADGRPVIVDKPAKSGGTYPDYNFGFVGQRICYGDPAVLKDKRLDPDRCPACRSAQNGTQGMTPERRFAFPVIRYKTKRGGVELQSPVGGDLLIWKLSQRMYNDLMAQKAEIRELLEIPADQEVRLSAADIVLQCRSKDFQGADFKSPRRPAHAHPEVAAFVRALWGDESNRPTEAQMKAACGRDNDEDSRHWMEQDVAQVEERWAIASRFGKNGAPLADPTGAGPVSGGQQDLGQSLNGLLEDTVGGLDEFASKGAPASAVADDPFGGSPAPASAPAVVDDPFGEAPAAPAQTPTAASQPAGGASQSFDDILSDLDAK